MPPGLVSLIEEGTPAQERRSTEAWRRSQQATGSILAAKLLQSGDLPGRLQSCYALCGDSKVTILLRSLTRASSSKMRWTFFMRCYLRWSSNLAPAGILFQLCTVFMSWVKVKVLCRTTSNAGFKDSHDWAAKRIADHTGRFPQLMANRGEMATRDLHNPSALVGHKVCLRLLLLPSSWAGLPGLGSLSQGLANL